jgi:OmpA-OmpF porin, OOP family
MKKESILQSGFYFPFAQFGKILRYMLLGIAFLVSDANAQSDKSLLLADKYFDEGEYYTAADLYGQYLNQFKKSGSQTHFPLHSSLYNKKRAGNYAGHTDILYKQAESYRLANLFEEAENLYDQCYKKNSVRFAESLFWIAFCQRNLQRFEEAEKNINMFIKEITVENKNYSAALNEKQTLEFIKKELNKPDSILYQVKKISPSDSGKQNNFFAPVALEDQFIITSTLQQKASAGSNPFINRLFLTTFQNNNMDRLQPLSLQIIDSNFNQGTASVSTDGQYLYFTQWKIEKGKPVSSIYYSIKTANGWDHPRYLNSVNQSESNTKHPFCSKDGKYLFFVSDRKEGYGRFDIWFASLLPDGSTTNPVNAGPIINTAFNEVAPFYHSNSQTLVFSSDKIPGMGGYDLYTSSGKELVWSQPQNMGYPVNSSRDESYFFSTAKENILELAYFSSDRGSGCCMDIYSLSKKVKSNVLSGMVLDCNNNQPLPGVMVNLKDATGKILNAITTENGVYSFQLKDQRQHQLFLTKDNYEQVHTNMDINKINDAAWQTDTLFNKDLCMAKKQSIKLENVVTVFFDFNQSKLKTRGIQQLDSIYNVLLQDSNASLQISGYTDGVGSDSYNKILSDKRAKACADYLISKGIEKNKISLESFGACCPLEMELINGRDNPDGRSMNRRALIHINKD